MLIIVIIIISIFRDYNKPSVMLFQPVLVCHPPAPIREIVCYFQFENFSSLLACFHHLAKVPDKEAGNQPANQEVKM